MATSNASSKSSTQNLEADFEAMKKDFMVLKDDIAQLIGTAKTAAGEKAQASYDSASEKAKQGYETADTKAREAYDRARSETEAAVERAAEEIKAHPFTGILIALGLGFLLGALIERR